MLFSNALIITFATALVACATAGTISALSEFFNIPEPKNTNHWSAMGASSCVHPCLLWLLTSDCGIPYAQHVWTSSSCVIAVIAAIALEITLSAVLGSLVGKTDDQVSDCAFS